MAEGTQRRALQDRYEKVRGNRLVFSHAPQKEGRYDKDGVFHPQFHPDIFVDQGCQFYHGKYVETQLMVGLSTLRALVAEERIFGQKLDGVFRIERSSLLKYLDEQHFVRRTDPSQKQAFIRPEDAANASAITDDAEDESTKPLGLTTYVEAAPSTKHDYLPELWGPDKVTDLMHAHNQDMARPSVHRMLIRFSEEGFISCYRLAGTFRYSREDWLNSMRRISEPHLLRMAPTGRPLRSLFTMTAPFIAAVIKEEGLDSRPVLDHIESIKWRHILRSQRNASSPSQEQLKKQAQEIYEKPITSYLDDASGNEMDQVEVIREMLYAKQ